MSPKRGVLNFSTRDGKVHTVYKIRCRRRSSEPYKILVLWFETEELKVMPSQFEQIIN
jgi:hypothetical protein